MHDASGSDPANNTTGWSRASTGLRRPKNIDEVRELVRQARRDKVPLYPFSTGLNYGYGGRSPVTGGCLLVDLGAMNGIRNAAAISLDNPVAIVEPGVTQRQLHDFLEQHCPALTFNVTGSAADTSILGNALERGVGYFGPRKEDLFGLEVVCGSGELLRTGFRRLGDDSPLAHSHPYGLGPMLDGLFFQGNYGIVTSACFRLIPKRPQMVALSLGLRREDDFPAFIDTLAGLKRAGLLDTVTHVANRDRTHASLMYGIRRYLEQECGMAPDRADGESRRALALVAPGEWTSLGALAGTRAQLKANLAEIRRRLAPIARVRIITDRKLDVAYALMHRLRRWPFARANAAAIAAIRPLHVLALGIPTDAPVDNLLWHFGRADLPATRLDASPAGILYICPALPLDGRFADQVIKDMKAIAAARQHRLYATVNIETASSLVAVINLLFDRTDADATARAQLCARELFDYLHGRKLEVYRARADMMADIVAADPGYWSIVRDLKRTLDPDNIIAPGRYNLPA